VGQRINISLLDFSGPVIAPRDRDITCRQYGYVVEKSTKNNVSICAVTSSDEFKRSRESAVYTSESNRVDIVLMTASNSENYNYLVKVHGKKINFSVWYKF
jgi:hypothetical protein